MEQWLWKKQTCPTCHGHVSMPKPLYWSSSRTTVPWWSVTQWPTIPRTLSFCMNFHCTHTSRLWFRASSGIGGSWISVRVEVTPINVRQKCKPRGFSIQIKLFFRNVLTTTKCTNSQSVMCDCMTHCGLHDTVKPRGILACSLMSSAAECYKCDNFLWYLSLFYCICTFFLHRPEPGL